MSAKTGKSFWFDLPVPDLEKARTFFGSLLGWEFRAMSNAPLPPYVMVEAGGELIGGLRLTPSKASNPGAVVYFTVDSLVPALNRALELGAEKDGETVDLGQGRGLYQWLKAPGGTLFALWASR